MSDEMKNFEAGQPADENTEPHVTSPAVDIPESEVIVSSFENTEKDTPLTDDFNEISATPTISATEESYDDSDRTVTNSYEWNGQETPSVPAAENTPKTSSGKGFRVFLGVMISVFTVSVLTLAALMFNYAKDDGVDKNKAQASENKTTENSGKFDENNAYDYSSVTFDNPNYVAFDFKEYKTGESLSIPEIAAKCTPSSVGIISKVELTYNYPFYFGGSSTSIAEASGSGFIFSSDGYVITNHHVIEDASNITVILHDGTELEAEVVGSDSLSDIAVLKITSETNAQLIPMEIGNSDELVVGEPVIAIGCPAGIEFIGTVTDGIVSSINRNVEITDSYGDVQKTMTLIQTNATINHGNSGGPLINSRGQVIGINTLKLAQDYEGIGFSIPMNGAVAIINQLIEHGKVVERTEEDFAYGKGIIGINGSSITEDESEYYGIPVGILVVQIDKEGSAAAAGLRRGDIITHYNGKKVATIDDINKEKNNARPGTEVTLTVYRDGDTIDGETIEITFKLDAQKN